MSHTNFHRKIKIRKPVPKKANRIIKPDAIYDRSKEKVKWSDILNEESDGFRYIE